MENKKHEITSRHLFFIEYICAPVTDHNKRREYWQIEYQSPYEKIKLKKK